MKYKILLIMAALLLVVPMVQGSLMYKQNDAIDIKIPCTFEGSPCTSALCNLTVQYPNGTYLLDNELMSIDINGDANYTRGDNWTVVGDNPSKIFCSQSGFNVTSTFNININPTGQEFTSSQGLISIGLIVGVLLLAGLFIFLGFKFFESDQTFPIGLLFICMALILGVYSLHLGYITSRDVLYPMAMESVQFTVYFGMMWGLIAISFFALLGLMWKTLREFRERKSINQQSDGWNDPRAGKGFYSENSFSKK